MMPASDTYPYGPEWIASVEKDTDEWRHYCEVVSYLKRYFRTQDSQGHAAAVAEWKKTLADSAMHAGRRHRLAYDFLRIGEKEGDRLRAEIQKPMP